jgi:chromosome partitioning protein
VIDTPPGLGLRVQAALIGAQFVLSPVELDDFGISGITDLLKVVFGIKQKINPDLAFVGMLPNRLNSASVAQKTALEELLAKYANYMVRLGRHCTSAGSRLRPGMQLPFEVR